MSVKYFFCLILLIANCNVYAQINITDSSTLKNSTNKLKQSLKYRILKSITGISESLTDTNRDVIANNIEQLSKYNGKQINNIIIEQHNFSSNINLPKINQRDYFTNIANKLHINSNDKAIRKNLFLKSQNIL
ncbi:MAG: hypothetical protein ACR2IM_04330, partial [Sediminibacterium sp.]